MAQLLCFVFSDGSKSPKLRSIVFGEARAPVGVQASPITSEQPRLDALLH
jgi:hypothetical protein